MLSCRFSQLKPFFQHFAHNNTQTAGKVPGMGRGEQPDGAGQQPHKPLHHLPQPQRWLCQKDQVFAILFR